MSTDERGRINLAGYRQTAGWIAGAQGVSQLRQNLRVRGIHGGGYVDNPDGVGSDPQKALDDIFGEGL
jgi:hypothetical protein